VNARQLETLVIEELQFLSSQPKVIENVVESATREQKEKLNELLLKKKTLLDRLTAVDKKAKHFVDLMGTEGNKLKGLNYIIKEIEALEEQAKQLRKEIDFISFEAGNYENKIINSDLIVENLKIFKDVYDSLEPEEKYDIIHLLVKSIIYNEAHEADKDGKKRGKMKMELWELPKLNPAALTQKSGFAERNDWRGGRGSNCSSEANNNIIS